MTTKIADLTVDEFKEVIREVIEEYVDLDGELNPQFEAELMNRLKSKDWATHQEVWNEK